MARDLVRWLCLLAVLMVAFAASISTIPHLAGDNCPNGVHLTLLFDAIVGGAAYVDCLDALEVVDGSLAKFLVFTLLAYLVVSLVMLLNMRALPRTRKLRPPTPRQATCHPTPWLQ